MRVLVTGGAGYIGSVVAQALLESGHDVVVLDDLSQGHADAVPVAARLVVLDLRDRAQVSALVKDAGVEAVVHMAGRSVVGESVDKPAEYYSSNLHAALVLLDILREHDVRRLVFSSTASVYGPSVNALIDEDDPLTPTNPYGETKLAIERAIFWHARAYGLAAVSLRYFNAAGATTTHGERHEPESHLIPRVLEVAAGARERIDIFGDDYATSDGTCIRDYVHVSDLARAHLVALGSLATNVGLSNANVARSYNVGAGRGHTVREVIEAAERATKRPIPVRVGPRRAGDPARLVANPSRLRRELGWADTESDLDSIMASAWRWMQTRGVVSGG